MRSSRTGTASRRRLLLMRAAQRRAGSMRASQATLHRLGPRLLLHLQPVNTRLRLRAAGPTLKPLLAHPQGLPHLSAAASTSVHHPHPTRRQRPPFRRSLPSPRDALVVAPSATPPFALVPTRRPAHPPAAPSRLWEPSHARDPLHCLRPRETPVRASAPRSNPQLCRLSAWPECAATHCSQERARDWPGSCRLLADC